MHVRRWCIDSGIQSSGTKPSLDVLDFPITSWANCCKRNHRTTSASTYWQPSRSLTMMPSVQLLGWAELASSEAAIWYADVGSTSTRMVVGVSWQVGPWATMISQGHALSWHGCGWKGTWQICLLPICDTSVCEPFSESYIHHMIVNITERWTAPHRLRQQDI